MPRKKSDSPGLNRTEFSGFQNVYLRKAEKVALEKWRKSHNDNPLPLIVELAEAGYLFSVKEDSTGDSYVATVNGYYDHVLDEHKGYILSARSADQYTAIWEVLYWHFVIAEKGDWGLLS